MKTIAQSLLWKTLAAAAFLPATFACGDLPPPDDDLTSDDGTEQLPDVKNRALVFPHDPLTDENLPVEVTLAAPTSEDGSLTNAYVNALNCTQKPGGTNLFGFLTLCVEESSARPDEEGSYLAVKPPEDFTDGQDPFAQVQMYHHVNVIHDFYKNSFGYTGLDFPLDAVVNITVQVQGQWQAFPNAAFIPEDSFAAFGLPPRDNGAIMFGQGDDVDFAYDASVIYHEYTHAMVGPQRMNAVSVKSSGLDNTAGAMNEGVADYFASSILDDPFLGHYALGSLGRDLASPRLCPEDLTTEIHADGKIIGTALWSIREELGSETTDGIAFRAIQSASAATGLDEFGELIRAEAAALGSETLAVVEPILIDHGVIGCERAKPWVNVDFARTAEGVPHQVEGTQAAQGGFRDGVPGYHQFYVDVPAGKAVALGWSISAQGGGFGGPAPGPLHLAVRKDATVNVGATGTITADAIVSNATFANSAQSVTLAGNCVPPSGGRVYLLFVNPNEAGSPVATMNLEIVDAPAADAVVATCD